MIDTRILQRGMRQQSAGSAGGHGRAGEEHPGVSGAQYAGDADTPAGDAPRLLQHDPILQGRVGHARPGGRRSKFAELSLARPSGQEFGIEDLWATLPEVGERLETVARRSGRLPDLGRTSPNGAAMDQLRSQILRVIGERGWRRLGVAGPRRGAGASFVATGLAASLARLEKLRILLIDLDLAVPSLHRYLDLPARTGLYSLLADDLPVIEAVSRLGDRLALLLNDQPISAAAEALYSPGAMRLLQNLDVALKSHLTILDLPPLLGDAAAQAAMEHVDALLLVADGTDSTARDISDCELLLQDQVPILGIVLNKSEDSPAPAGRA